MLPSASRLLGFGALIALAMVLPLEQRPALAGGGETPPPGGVSEAPRPGATDWPIERDLRPRGSERVVPVVLHMMHNTACHRDADDCRLLCPTSTPTCQWSPERVKRHFGRDGGINEIWRAAGVRLAVVAVRQCAYDPREFHQDRDEIAPGIPVETKEMWAVPKGRGQRYDEVNRRFGVGDALNVFLWIHTEPLGEASITYFGSSPLHPLVGVPKRSIVWADILCVLEAPERREAQKFTPAACSRKLAHEVGHALTLRHTDDPPAQGPETGTEFPSCRDRDTTSETALRLNLMLPSTTVTDRDDVPRHVKLTAWQRCQALNAAAAFFRPERFSSH
jgi:hypothetical protein